ncbi:MAG: GTP 3',8-cyclase MoaA [Planctomycetota bacterium JB042]
MVATPAPHVVYDWGMARLDRHDRPLRNLRVSVTDRCNLRCAYCMPEQEYTWLPKPDILTFDEIERLVRVFAGAGVDKVRFTGGEPLLRQELPVLIERVARTPGLRDIAMTTNGILLADAAPDLRRAGLHRVTVSLDTLREDRFRALTRRGGVDHVLAGIASLAPAGFRGTRIDTVVMRGVNDDELLDLLDAAAEHDAELRFIEYMDVGGATGWSMEQVVPRDEILARLEDARGPIEPLPAADATEAAAPAERFRFADGRTFGLIASTTAPFCARCDRSRLTADGHWYLCLYARLGIDLKGPLRAGATDDELRARLERTWTHRDDRGAEERLRAETRAALVARDDLRDDPRLEMHTRGG